jgi:hypothetical protein
MASTNDRQFLWCSCKTNSKSAGIITTEEELQAYHTIRTLLIQNNSSTVPLAVNVQAITFNTATRQEDTRILLTQTNLPTGGTEPITLAIADRLTNIDTILRISYRFDIDYPERPVGLPASMTSVNNVELRRQDLRFVDNSQFGNSEAIGLAADPPPEGWYDASFGFLNNGPLGNYLTFTVTTVSVNYITKVLDSSFVGQDSIAPEGTGLFSVGIDLANRLRYNNSLFRISYSYTNGNTAVISNLTNATIFSESPGQIDLLPGTIGTDITFALS